MKIIKIHKPPEFDTFFVTWTLHNLCNFRCSYCPKGLNDGSVQYIKFHHVKEFYDKLKSKLSDDTKIVFAFSGGEPTLHPEFFEIVQYLSSNGCEVTMTTNGGKGLKWWKEVEPYIEHLVISYHPEFSKFDKIMEKVLFLKETCYVNIDLLMHPNYWDELISYGEEFKKIRKNVSVHYLPIQENFGTNSGGLLTNYTKEQVYFLSNPPSQYGDFLVPKNKLKKCNGFLGRWRPMVDYDDGSSEVIDYKKIISRNLNKFSGMKCNIGLEGLVIEYADVYKGYCHMDGLIGNILDNNFQLPSTPVICDREQCVCSVDIEISKES